MGHYHNKLDKKYFKNSVYIKKFEEVFNVSIKDYPLQYELIYETYNAFLFANNSFFSKGYKKTSDILRDIIENNKKYLTKYKNKINKCYDSACILIYENLKAMVDDFEEILNVYEKKNNKNDILKSHCKEQIKYLEEMVMGLEAVRFDWQKDSKEMPYYKKVNEKLPRKINCKVLNQLEIHGKIIWVDEKKQQELNDTFIKQYLKKTGINLNEKENQREMIFEIYTTIKDLHNAIVDFIIYRDIKKIELHLQILSEFMNMDFSILEDIYYTNLVKRIHNVCLLICDGEIKKAHNEILDIVSENKDVFERTD